MSTTYGEACPVCGKDIEDLWDYFGLSDAARNEMECPHCGARLEIATDTQYILTTVEPKDEIEAQPEPSPYGRDADVRRAIELQHCLVCGNLFSTSYPGRFARVMDGVFEVRRGWACHECLYRLCQSPGEEA